MSGSIAAMQVSDLLMVQYVCRKSLSLDSPTMIGTSLPAKSNKAVKSGEPLEPCLPRVRQPIESVNRRIREAWGSVWQ